MKVPLNLKENFDTSGLFRMPWTKSDNGNAWLSITRACDITCEYCVQDHNGQKHKSIMEVTYDLKGILKLRNCDSIQIAGGEPLIHPQIVEIVRLVRSNGLKPFIITNGVSLDKELLRELKNAGLFGLILHVDSGQNRPGWEGKSEQELNDLRNLLADMIHKERGLICSFISTITPKSLKDVPEIVKWCRQNMKKVVQQIFVPVRSFHRDDPWNYYVNGKETDIFSSAICNRESYDNISAKDLVNEVKKVLPDYKFGAFLGGTKVPNAPKWLFGLYAATSSNYIGNLGRKGMEIVQNGHHMLFGKFVTFLKPRIYKHGRLIYLLSAFDKDIRGSLKRQFLRIIKDPAQLLKRVRLQSIHVMQPFDLLSNGECDMCDGCPNMTYLKGRLVPECRMEEYINYGQPVEFEFKG